MVTMDRDIVRLSVERIYGDWGIESEAIDAIVDDAPAPRTPDILYDIAAGLGINTTTRVLDVGCRDARHAALLAERFHCDAIAFDITRFGLDVAQRRLGRRIPLLQAGVEAMPFRSASVGFIWCRDMLNHVDLPRALAECARVLRPGAPMLVYQTFATPLLADFEAETISARESIPWENMDSARFERIARETELEIESKDEQHAEWRESGELAERTARGLLRVSRMLRDRERIEGAIGSEMYAYALSGYQWGVYQMLGKLAPIAYVLRRT